MRRLLRPAPLAIAGVAALAAAALVVAFAPAGGTYIFLPDEAHPVAPLVTVEGGSDPRGPGGIYFVNVIVRKATLAERLFPSLREGSSLVSADEVNPTGISDSVRRRGSLREMTRSQRIAAAVALRELGYRVQAIPVGALVTTVLADTPAATALRPSDVITRVDGRRVATPDDLRRLIRDRAPGDFVRLTVLRGGEARRFRLRTIADPEHPRRPVIGVISDQEAKIDLPLSVRIDAGDVGGPSAGLAFALDLLEELGRDVDRGRRVAVTGALELDGDVTPVGGVRQKIIGARRTDVDVFVVPAGDNAREARRYAGDVQVVPVDSFRQALRRLATTGQTQ